MLDSLGTHSKQRNTAFISRISRRLLVLYSEGYCVATFFILKRLQFSKVLLEIGADGEYVYRDVTLPHHGKEHRGKAVGLLVIPTPKDGIFSQNGEPFGSDEPHLLVVAMDTERYELFLSYLQWGMGVTILIITLSSTILIYFILRAALRPIDELSSEILAKNVDQLQRGVLIPPKFPLELRELVGHYNGLLKRVEDARMREKNFSSYVAHELRTPLAGISTTLELALQRPRDAGYYNKRIHETLEITLSMQKLISLLFSLSRLQNNSSVIHDEKVDIQEILDGAWEKVSKRAVSRDLEVVWDIQTNQADVQTDCNLLSVLIGNLIDNAVSYAVADSIIKIQMSEMNDRLQINISNQTEDLDISDLGKLFDPFFRKDGVRGVDGNHFGLGLSLCQEISRVLHLGLTSNMDDRNVIVFCLSFDR